MELFDVAEVLEEVIPIWLRNLFFSTSWVSLGALRALES
jgi:hypothetical protein